MNFKFSLLVLCLLLLVASCHKQQPKSDSGPKMWDDAALSSLDLPLADPSIKLQHGSAADYYRIPQRRIWKSYPVYAPGHEPPGYIEDLEQREPEVAFDASQFKSDEDWIKGGELVFDAPITHDNL